MDDESTLEIDEYGTKWWKNKRGKLHRLNGPARECFTGNKYWYKNGRLHRSDGPAFTHSDGYNQWWLNNVFYETKEEYFDALSDEAKTKCLFSEDFLNG
jgi:hypothetical protein